MIVLPPTYIERIQQQLGPEEAELFLATYNEPRTQGLRLNSLKVSSESSIFDSLQTEFQLEQVAWCSTGYYYGDQVRPGKHPYHAAGLYYIQEPSAMSAVELLDPQPGDLVLDLAAAPGGKSTQIAAKLQGQGLLVANEIHPARAKILSENIERMGVTNAVVVNSAPGPLAERFPEFFDKIMLDAPCSGEGMFRKDPDAIGEWSLDHVTMCANRGMDILDDAVRMLKPGGYLCYSTCTFAPAENELTVEALVGKYPEFKLIKMERIWPHLHKGEGHFVALLQKSEAAESVSRTRKTSKYGGKMKGNVQEALQLFESFRQEVLPEFELGPGEALLFGEQLYWFPTPSASTLTSSDLGGMKVLRPGLHLGEIKKNRIEPAHSLALAVPIVQRSASIELSSNSPEVAAYLRGEAIFRDGCPNGWVVVQIDGYPIGWGKASGGQVKNHYPKGLRQLGS